MLRKKYREKYGGRQHERLAERVKEIPKWNLKSIMEMHIKKQKKDEFTSARGRQADERQKVVIQRSQYELFVRTAQSHAVNTLYSPKTAPSKRVFTEEEKAKEKAGIEQKEMSIQIIF